MGTESLHLVRNETFDVDSPEVYVQTVSGSVKIIESIDGMCHVKIAATPNGEKYLADAIDITSHGRKVSVRVGKQNGRLRDLFSARAFDVFIEIEVPRTSTVKVNAVSADIEVNQTLTNLDVNTVSSDVSVLKNPARTCAIKTVSGDINVHTFSGCDFALKSVSGDIGVHVAPGLEIDVDSKSVSGDLESEIDLGSYSDSRTENAEKVTISAVTVSGDFVLARN